MDSTGQRPYFFVSYAHDQGDGDRYVNEFYRDLSADVALHSGEDKDRVGFCDATLRVGDRWSPALVQALRTCQVFLALCSPMYFSRPSCGKEWTIFTERLATLERTSRERAASLIPLFWIQSPMPAIAQPYQYRDSSLGEAYDKHGLRDLLYLKDTPDRYLYHRFVGALAKRIVHLVGQHDIPPHPWHPEFDSVRAAFPASPSGLSPSGPSPSGSSPTGDRRGPGPAGQLPTPRTFRRNDDPLSDQDPPRPILNQNDK